MSLNTAINRSPQLEILFVLLWNSGFIGGEYGLPYAGPFTLLFWRYLALSGALGLWLVVTDRWKWPGRRAVGRMGLVGVLAHGVWLTCVLVALDMDVPAGIVALITALQPLMTGAFSGVALGERTGSRQWVGLALGFCGVSIAVAARLSQDGNIPALGYLIPFGSVVSMTAASLLQRRWTRNASSEAMALDTSLFYQGSFTALALLVPAWRLEGFATEWTTPFLGAMAWLIIVVSIGAYWTMWRLLARQEATRVASLFYLSPPVTMLMAWLAFGDALVATDLLGLAIAGVGVALVYGPGPRLVLSKSQSN